MSRMTPRHFLASMVFAFVAVQQPAQAPATAGPVPPALIEDLVAAYRILAQQGVLDGFGHVSLRHPRNPNRFIMARSLAPELVTAADLIEFELDGNPTDAKGRARDSDRCSHTELYTRCTD